MFHEKDTKRHKFVWLYFHFFPFPYDIDASCFLTSPQKKFDHNKIKVLVFSKKPERERIYLCQRLYIQRPRRKSRRISQSLNEEGNTHVSLRGAVPLVWLTAEETSWSIVTIGFVGGKRESSLTRIPGRFFPPADFPLLLFFLNADLSPLLAFRAKRSSFVLTRKPYTCRVIATRRWGIVSREIRDYPRIVASPLPAAIRRG